MEYQKQTLKEGQERIGHTKWMVNNSKKEDLDKLMGMVPERTASVPDLLLPRLGEKNMSVEVMSELAGFNRATGYKIINGKQRAEFHGFFSFPGSPASRIPSSVITISRSL